MTEIGRVCVKIAGRDAGKKCVIVDADEKGFVLVDGETRRRKVNPSHLEPLEQTLKIKKGASHEEVVAAFKTIGIAIPEKVVKKKAEKPAKAVAPAAKPAAKKAETKSA